MRSRTAVAAVLATAIAALASGAAAASAAPVPANADWTESYITEADGTKLHADVLRPKGLPDDATTPVILSIGPYFNHSGQTGPAGPVEGTTFDPTAPAGPSDRFLDFVNGAHLMDRGYTFVMVDLRGFGGSSGCLDWVGPGEQADVKSAVQWAASQPWSTGKVGMYGKSYDGVTGPRRRGRAAAGPRRRRRAGAGLRPLPLPVLERRAVRELARHARPLRHDRRDAGHGKRRPDATTSTAPRSRPTARSRTT